MSSRDAKIKISYNGSNPVYVSPEEVGSIIGDVFLEDVELDNTDLIFTLNDNSTITFDATAFLADIYAESGVYNPGTESLVFTLTNGATFSVPVSALLPVTTDSTIDGNGNTVPLSAVEMTGADGVTDGEKGIVPTPVATDNVKFLKGDATWSNVTKADVGLGNVDNTSDLDKPVSTAQQAALDLKYDASNPSGYVDTAGASAAAPVQDVNGETGNVVLDTDDVNEGTTNLYFTDPRVAASPSVAANTLKVSADGSIDTHSDVDTTTTPPGTDDVLSWNGSEWVPQDPDSIIDEVELVRNFYVSKNGNDGTGTGSLSKPFLTIGACITYINANLTLGPDNNAIINVAAGEYTEGTLALPRFCSLEGKGYRTKITASSGSIDLITSQGANTIKGLILRGVTNASNYLINVSATQDTRTIIEEISLSDYEGVGTISNGIKLSSTSGTLTVRARALDFDDITGTCILLDNNTELVVKENRTFDGCSGATYLDAQGNCTYSVTDVEVCNLNLALNHNTTGDGRFVDSNIRKAATNIIKTTSSILTVSNVNLSSNRVLLTEEDKVNGNYRDDVSGDEKLRVIDELSVGLPGAGKESVFGEGDSYTNGILVYTFDGSIYTDVTDDAIDLEANTFSFPNTNDDSAIYVSTERLGSGSPLMFPGVKVDVQTAAVLGAGEIVAEYWNGSSWVEFNHVSTQSFGKFLPFAKQVFERTGEEHIRFNYEIEDDWAINDPVSFGTDLHWMRFRLEGNITTSPVFQSLKVHSNRSEINADGYKEFFGSARPVSTLPFDIGNFEASANSPSNADVYFSDVLGVGRQENLFADSTTDRVGLAKPFPSDIDTSCPIILKLYWTNQDFSDPDPFDITVYWANSVIGDTVGDSQGDVPATVPTQQSIQQDYTLTATNEIAFQEFTLDVSGVIARRDSDPGDILWLSVERSPDSNGSDIILVQLQIEYTKLSAGGHI